MKELNIANSRFDGLNSHGGLMLCGYEWGDSKADSTADNGGDNPDYDPNATVVFSNKVPAHGVRALNWKYDNKIKKWFDMWGHPLREDGLGGDFEKSIVQTNWANTKNHDMESTDYFGKLLAEDQIDNFVFHLEELKPSLIMFFGTHLISALQNDLVLKRVKAVLGEIVEPLTRVQKESVGTKFRIGFQKFENCDVIGLPHASGARGLRDDYFIQFKDEIGHLIADFKKRKSIS
jgi:hypothetical protein